MSAAKRSAASRSSSLSASVCGSGATTASATGDCGCNRCGREAHVRECAAYATDRAIDVVGADAVVGDATDPITARVVDHLRAGALEGFEEGHAQLGLAQFEEHEIGADVCRIE